ncbi:corticotropin-releasing factor receptor 1-like [Uloborus diversus]|uniref:corticotropin-releasing factor receptor 1-like n=1 Tax=Uloborus diversus TaxID=327109 RepID=UPI00240A2DE0|nr:corticotropin-releasing factor receptor 1-like [Uloborus diversus]
MGVAAAGLCHHYSVAFRFCGEDGLWSAGKWTNYSECQRLLDIREREEPPLSPVTVSYVILVGSVLSLVCLLITLFIFAYFKALQCSRVRVHRNLVLSLILHALMMLAVALPGISREVEQLYRSTDWLCKAVLVLKMYSSMACIQWMFVEGLLLHSSVAVSVFRKEAPFRVYYGLGWGLPLLCVATWVALMCTHHQEKKCWKGYGHSPYVWFITGPMILALLVNAVFLVNIIRILVTKLRNSLSVETKQVKKAMKATALLIPLLGITHLLFCINPRDEAELEHLYMLVNALMQASQGLFVAVLYCFLNSEVQSVLSSAYSRRMLRRGDPRRPSCRSSSTRVLSTASTTLPLTEKRTAFLLVKTKADEDSKDGETTFL